MSKKVDIVSFLLLCFAVIMLCFSSLMDMKKMKETRESITELEEQNEVLLYKYEIQENELVELQESFNAYASETDAKIKSLTTDVEKLQLEKEVNEAELHQSPQTTVVGTYELTAYIATGNPCADGVYPQVGYTVASNDPSLWHKWIHIDGYGDYFVHDRGGMPNNVLDVFVDSYSEAIQFGRRSATVSIIDK